MLTSRQNRNVARLAVAQALSMTSMNVNIINTALVGVLLAPMAWLATLPLSLQFLTSMMVTLPASLLMSRYGRRPILIAGVLISSLSTLCLGIAVVIGSFPLFCGGGMGLGAAMGIAGYYRYAAADGVAEDLRPKAISYVLAGGLAAAILGPEIARRTVDILPDFLYAGCFFTVAIVCSWHHSSCCGASGLKSRAGHRLAGVQSGPFCGCRYLSLG